MNKAYKWADVNLWFYLEGRACGSLCWVQWLLALNHTPNNLSCAKGRQVKGRREAEAEMDTLMWKKGRARSFSTGTTRPRGPRSLTTTPERKILWLQKVHCAYCVLLSKAGRLHLIVESVTQTKSLKAWEQQTLASATINTCPVRFFWRWNTGMHHEHTQEVSVSGSILHYK